MINLDVINDSFELSSSLTAGLCEQATFNTGEVVREQGIHYSSMYLIVKGSVEVKLENKEAPIIVNAGSPIGEIGFLKGCPATATAIAREHTRVVILDDATLWRIEQEEPLLAVFLLRSLASTADERLEENSSLISTLEQTDNSKVDVLLCRTQEVLNSAMRMRYDVYCGELGRSSPYADHDKKIISDNLDDFGHTFIANDEEGNVIGTMRANFSSEGDLGILGDIYNISSSAAFPEHTAVCTKFIVEKKKRGSSAAMALIRSVKTYLIAAGAHECYIDCIPSLIPLYKRIGFKEAGEKFFHYENGTSVPMVLDLRT